MSKLKLLVLFLALAGISTIACKKEEAAPAKKETIAKKWTMTEYIQAGQPFPSSMLTGSFITFNAAGTYSMKFIFQVDSGTWAFNANETEIILDGNNRDLELTLRELTSSSLKLRWAYNDSINVDMSFVP